MSQSFYPRTWPQLRNHRGRRPERVCDGCGRPRAVHAEYVFWPNGRGNPKPVVRSYCRACAEELTRTTRAAPGA